MTRVRCLANGRLRRRGRLVAAARALGLEVVWSRGPGELERLARQALAEGVERLVVAGGDGSVAEVVNGLPDARVPLGIVPAGTGNDLARTLQLPAGIPAALRLALEGPARPMDLGELRIRGPGGEVARRFANCVELGFGARTVAIMDRVGRLAGRRLAYPLGILGALLGHRTWPMRVLADGHALDMRAFTNLVIANGRHFGRGLRPAPRALLDDGVLDVLAVPAMPRRRILARLPELRRGPRPEDPDLHALRAREILVESEAAVPVEADGNRIDGMPPVMVRVLPGALAVVTPTGPHEAFATRPPRGAGPSERGEHPPQGLPGFA